MILCDMCIRTQNSSNLKNKERIMVEKTEKEKLDDIFESYKELFEDLKECDEFIFSGGYDDYSDFHYATTSRIAEEC